MIAVTIADAELFDQHNRVLSAVWDWKSAGLKTGAFKPATTNRPGQHPSVSS
jgi:hypothetical protein